MGSAYLIPYEDTKVGIAVIGADYGNDGASYFLKPNSDPKKVRFLVVT